MKFHPVLAAVGLGFLAAHGVCTEKETASAGRPGDFNPTCSCDAPHIDVDAPSGLPAGGRLIGSRAFVSSTASKAQNIALGYISLPPKVT